MAEKYPDTFSIAIFIDDGIKRGFCTENSIDEMQIKKTLTACYQSALDVLNDYSAESKNENSGIILTIKTEDKKMNVKDFVLTDDEIMAFASKFANYVKDVLSVNYRTGKTHGDYHTGCHFGYSDMVDAATYGANAVYDLMLKKIMDCGSTTNDIKEKAQELGVSDEFTSSDIVNAFNTLAQAYKKENSIYKVVSLVTDDGYIIKRIQITDACKKDEICYAVYIPTKMSHTDIKDVNLILNQHKDKFVIPNYIEEYGRDFIMICVTKDLTELLLPIITRYKNHSIGSAVKLK